MIQHPAYSTIPVRRLPPRHAQRLKDPPLILPLHLDSLRYLQPVLSPNHIAIEPALIQPHSLFARQQPHTSVEDIVSREVYHCGTDLVPGNRRRSMRRQGLVLVLIPLAPGLE